MKRRLGQLEAQMLAYLQMRGQGVARTGDLARVLRLSREQERQLFRRLARGRLIARVRPGLYLVPPQLPLGGSWSPDPVLALNTLIADRDGRYQICGPNAFGRYGFTDQMPARVYAYNNRTSGERTVGSVALTLIKVADRRLGDTEEMRTPGGQIARYSSRARTLVDAVYDWSRFGSLPRAFGWIRAELAAGRVRPKELVECTLRYGDVGTIRRIGALLERDGVSDRILRPLDQALKPSTGLIPWIPGRPKRGSVNGRWGVVMNERA